jgi:hypothetical protein
MTFAIVCSLSAVKILVRLRCRLAVDPKHVFSLSMEVFRYHRKTFFRWQ